MADMCAWLVVRFASNAACERLANTTTARRKKNKPTGTIKHTLLRSNHFNKCIRRAGVDAENNPSARSEKIDFTKERFYIDTSVKLKSTEPPSYTSAIITSAIIIVVSVILFWCMPDILELISGVNMLGTK